MHIHDSYKKSLRQSVWVLLVLAAAQLVVWLLPMPHAASGIANYLPLHILLEMVSIVIAVLVFAVGWSAFEQQKNMEILLPSCVFMGVAILDFLHMLSYPGMPEFITPSSAEKAIDFWLSARLVAAVGLLAFSIPSLRKRCAQLPRLRQLGMVLLPASILVWLELRHPGWLPLTFSPETGLTSFKVASEYVLIALYALAAFNYLRNMRTPQSFGAVGLFGAVGVMTMSEMFFTLYSDVTDIYNLLGHVYKAIAYGFIYRSIFVSSIREPYRRLQESRRLLQTVIDSVPISIFWKDRALRYVGSNVAFARDAGVAGPQDLIGKDDTQLAWKNQSQQYRADDLQVIESGIPKLGFEEPQTSADGSAVWLRTSKVPLRDAENETTGVLGVYENITQSKLAEDKLRLSEERFRSIIERIENVAIQGYDQDRRIIFWNAASEALYGYSREEAEGRRLEELIIPPAMRDEVVAAVERWKSQGVPIPAGELVLQKKDGSPVHVYSSHTMQVNRLGQAEMYCLDIDISARKQAEEALQLAAMVYQSTSEAMMVTDTGNRIIATNPAFTEMTGYSFEEVQGKNPSVLSSGRQDAEFYRALWHVLGTTGQWQGEIWNKRKNGEEYAEWLTINTIHTEDGAVHRRVALFSDITEKKKADALIWTQANYDNLTQLPNRRLFIDRLEQEIRKAHRENYPFALLLLDLDLFKEVNDTLGHHVGDELLVETAQRILRCVQESDTVARLGGDEFAILMTDRKDLTTIAQFAQGILDALSAPFVLNGERVYVSASIGITAYPNDATTVEDLLKHADQAMYAAKSNGRNRYNYFTKAMQDAAQIRVRLASDLRGALEAGQLHLNYQPVVDLGTGEILKAEALLRWNHPKYGQVSPADFIPIAEETGIIRDIGDWVFREAARQLARWRATYRADLQISVNKSPVQFSADVGRNSHARWFDWLKEFGLPGESIAVEITEGILMDASADVIRQLLEFRDAGIQVSLDDFGTGYSSLSYLKKFDIDFLKIDQSFTRNLAPGSSDMVLCEAIVVMAHKLGMQVIAEGVETRQQEELLRAMGCDYGQGYLISRPLAAEEFEKLLQQERNASLFSGVESV